MGPEHPFSSCWMYNKAYSFPDTKQFLQLVRNLNRSREPRSDHHVTNSLLGKATGLFATFCLLLTQNVPLAPGSSLQYNLLPAEHLPGPTALSLGPGEGNQHNYADAICCCYLLCCNKPSCSDPSLVVYFWHLWSGSSFTACNLL